MGVVRDESHHLRLECCQRFEAAPAQPIFQITPDTLGRIDLRTIGWLEDQHDVDWKPERLCAMTPTIVHEHQVQRVRVRGRQFVHECLHVRGIHPRYAKKEAIPIRRCHRAIQPEVVEAVLESPDGFRATQREAPPTDRMQSKPTLIEDPQLYRPLVFGGNRGLHALWERGTKGSYGDRVFFSWLGRTTFNRALSLSWTTVCTA